MSRNHGCFTGCGVPACDASIVGYEVKKAINQDDQPFGGGAAVA
jgi:hypothetical protein